MFYRGKFSRPRVTERRLRRPMTSATGTHSTRSDLIDWLASGGKLNRIRSGSPTRQLHSGIRPPSVWNPAHSGTRSGLGLVGMFVCPISNTTSKFHRIFCIRGSVLLWRQCNKLCTSGFVDDVTFSHSGANGPDIRYKDDDTYVLSSSPDGSTTRTSDNIVWSNSLGGGTGGEVCRLRLHLIWIRRWPSKILNEIFRTVVYMANTNR